MQKAVRKETHLTRHFLNTVQLDIQYNFKGFDNPTCPGRVRGMCDGLQRASAETEGGNSWIGASSRSSMRGFLMLDSGLVRGVTLFLLIKVPGPLLTSCREPKQTHAWSFMNKDNEQQLLRHRKWQWLQLSEMSSHYLWSLPVGIYCLHIQGDWLHFASISNWGEFEHRVEGTLQVGHFIWNNKWQGKYK